MFQKVCCVLGCLLMAFGFVWGIFLRSCLWAVLPAFILMAIGNMRMTDDE